MDRYFVHSLETAMYGPTFIGRSNGSYQSIVAANHPTNLPPPISFGTIFATQTARVMGVFTR